jgi:predicted DNA-binding transcriptional regulator AlpA
MVLHSDQLTTQGSVHAMSGAPETTKPPLRSAEAATYINMSDSWLRQSRMAGRTDGPVFVRAGARAIRYRLADLDRWLEQRVCAAGERPRPEPAPPPASPKRGRKPLARKGGRRRPVR